MIFPSFHDFPMKNGGSFHDFLMKNGGSFHDFPIPTSGFSPRFSPGDRAGRPERRGLLALPEALADPAGGTGGR